MSTVYKIMRIIQIIDAVDTLDLVTDFDKYAEANASTCDINPDDEFTLEDIKVPQRSLRDMTNPVEMFSDNEFRNRYSFSKETVLHILELIVHGLERSSNRGKPVPPLIELLITIKFMTTGTFQSMIDDLHGVSQPTISRFILKVSTLLAELKHQFVKFPSVQDTVKISKQFYEETNHKFPNVIGCLGATHVGIKNPGGQISEAYLNEHGYYSLKVQVICGPNNEFLDFFCRWPGSTHESKIFNISEIKTYLEAHDIPGYLLGSSRYTVMKNVLTPIDNSVNRAQLSYNKAHASIYNVAETVGLWKRRFKCLTSVLANKEETTRNIIHASAVLHNIALLHKEQLPEADPNEPLIEPKGKEIKRCFPLDTPLKSDPSAVKARDKFIAEHFN